MATSLVNNVIVGKRSYSGQNIYFFVLCMRLISGYVCDFFFNLTCVQDMHIVTQRHNISNKYGNIRLRYE